MTSRRRPSEQDCGAALILAVLFVVAIGIISGGLAGLATSGLNNRYTLEAVRDRQFAADGAIENAISQARTFDCTTVTTPILGTFNQISIRVDVTNACLPTSVRTSDGTLYPQRNVIFSACVDVSSVCAPASVIIRAQVNFEPASGVVAKTYIQSWSINR